MYSPTGYYAHVTTYTMENQGGRKFLRDVETRVFPIFEIRGADLMILSEDGEVYTADEYVSELKKFDAANEGTSLTVSPSPRIEEGR